MFSFACDVFRFVWWNQISYIHKSVHVIYLALFEVLIKNIPANLTEIRKEEKKIL